MGNVSPSSHNKSEASCLPSAKPHQLHQIIYHSMILDQQTTPIFQHLPLDQIYPHPQTHRYSALVGKFKQRFASTPHFLCRAPGRVNLIGSHIDHQGYGVFPFAIQRDCLIAVGLCDTDTIEIKHEWEERFEDHVVSTDPDKMPEFRNFYVRYFFAGYQAALKEVGSIDNLPQEVRERIQRREFQGMKVLISGNVPLGAGLSSSSSLCVCAALLTARAYNTHNLRPKVDFINQVIKYQRLVGTACGGMDQSISILGQRDSSLFIEFNPIRSTTVVLPESYRFVVMDSLEESNKVLAVGTRFNKRVCECCIAIQLIATKLGIPKEESCQLKTLGNLQEYLKLSLENMLMVIDEFLEKTPLTRQALEDQLGPLEVLLKDIPKSQRVLEVDQTYEPYNTCKHVFSEAARVQKYYHICSSHLSDQIKAPLMGTLMNESHQSSRVNYRSCSNHLNQLTALARSKGAVGSKLTGAGWGGCTVSMVEAREMERFMQEIREEYYGREEFKQKVGKLGMDNVVFEVVAVRGACFVDVDSVDSHLQQKE